MSNDQAQTPTGGLDENVQNKIKINMKNNNDKSYNKSNNRYRGNSRTASSSDTPSRNLEGEVPSRGVVLGLSFEKLR